MLNEPIKYQIQFMRIIKAKAEDMPRFVFGINLAHHNMRVSENRQGIYMVERHIARRERIAAEIAKVPT